MYNKRFPDLLNDQARSGANQARRAGSGANQAGGGAWSGANKDRKVGSGANQAGRGGLRQGPTRPGGLGRGQPG